MENKTQKELINDDSKFSQMSEMAFNDPSTSGNPVQLEKSDFFKLYKEAFTGIL